MHERSADRAGAGTDRGLVLPDPNADSEPVGAVLRRSLADLGPGVRAIRDQLAQADQQLRTGVEPAALPAAVENLGALFELLHHMAGSLAGSPLPELGLFHAAVERFVENLDDAIATPGRNDAIAGSLETDLLPALDAWPAVEVELSAAVRSIYPEEFKPAP